MLKVVRTTKKKLVLGQGNSEKLKGTRVPIEFISVSGAGVYMGLPGRWPVV